MIFLYPLRLAPLTLILASTFGIWLAFMNIILWLLGLFFFIFCIPAFAKYLFSCLQAAANGTHQPPPLTLKLFRPLEEWRHIKLIFILATFYYFHLFLISFSLSMLSKIFIAYVLLSLPAIIGLLAMSNSMLIALNPVSQLQFIKKSASDYGYILASIFICFYCAYSAYISNDKTFLAIFIVLYSAVLLFHWLGKLIYNKRVIFNYHPNNSPEREAERIENELLHQRNQALYRVNRENNIENSLKVMRAYIETEEDEVTAYRWFYEEIKFTNNNKLIQAHGKQYIEILELAGKTAAAEMIKDQLNENRPMVKIPNKTL